METVETDWDVPHLGNDKTAYLIGLFGSGRSYINELLLQHIGERAKYFREDIRIHAGPTSMIYSGHATMRHISRFQAPPAVTGQILEAVRSGFADSIFVYRHPLDSLLTNWIWWRTYIRDMVMISGISQLYKNIDDLCADLDRDFFEFKAFAEGDPDFFAEVPGPPESPRFLSFAEFVEETELHLEAATLTLRLEDFAINPLNEFSKVVELLSVDLDLSGLLVPAPRTKPYGYQAVQEKVTRFRRFIDGLNEDTKRRIEKLGYPGPRPTASLSAKDRDSARTEAGVDASSVKSGPFSMPLIGDPALEYAHIHRYIHAIPFVEGKTVLDLGSVDGYGAQLLAGSASQVVGVYADETVVRRTRERYRRDNLEFVFSAVTNVPVSESQVFDVVTCFETIERIAQPTELLAEIKRLLKPNGILILSMCSKKTARGEETVGGNFRQHSDLDFQGFQSLLRQYFRHSRFLGQGIFAHSGMWPIGGYDSTVREYTMRREGSEFDLAGEGRRTPLYYIAIASDSELPADPGGSVLVDSGNELLLEKDRLLAESQAESENRDISLLHLGRTLAWRSLQVVQMEKGIAWLRHSLADHRKVEQRLEITLQQLGTAIWNLEEIQQSSGWKSILLIRKCRERLLPDGSLRRRVLQRIIRFVRMRCLPSP